MDNVEVVRNVFLHINPDTHMEELIHRLSMFEMLGTKVKFFIMDSIRSKDLGKVLSRGEYEFEHYPTLYLDEDDNMNNKTLYGRVRHLCSVVDEVIISTSLTDGMPFSSLVREVLLREKQIVTLTDTPRFENSDGSYGFFLSATDDKDGLMSRRLTQLKEQEEKLIVYTTTEMYDDLVSENCDYLEIPCVRLNYNGNISQHVVQRGDLITDKVHDTLMLRVNEVMIDSCRRSTNSLKNEVNFLIDCGKPITSVNHYGKIIDTYAHNTVECIEWS